MARFDFDPDRWLMTHADVPSRSAVSIVKLLVSETHFEALCHDRYDRPSIELGKGLSETDAPAT